MAAVPSGTVTFLLTDIEGSTRRWERHPAAMRTALARHDTLLHEGIAAHHGVVLTERGEGDSFFAFFARPSDALAACTVQRRLLAEPWPPEVAPIRVRMALHTGEAGLWEGGDYRGVAVNRCARLRSAAHGGQVLLSGATYELGYCWEMQGRVKIVRNRLLQRRARASRAAHISCLRRDLCGSSARQGQPNRTGFGVLEASLHFPTVPFLTASGYGGSANAATTACSTDSFCPASHANAKVSLPSARRAVATASP
jgi:class 3 adenylate cyclase